MAINLEQLEKDNREYTPAGSKQTCFSCGEEFITQASSQKGHIACNAKRMAREAREFLARTDLQEEAESWWPGITKRAEEMRNGKR